MPSYKNQSINLLCKSIASFYIIATVALNELIYFARNTAWRLKLSKDYNVWKGKPSFGRKKTKECKVSRKRQHFDSGCTERKEQNKKETTQVPTPQKPVTDLLKKKKSKGIKKCLLFAEGVSQYIRASIVEWKNMRESIKRVLSGKDWRSTNLFSMPYQKGESIAKRIWAKLCLKLSMFKVKEVDLTLTFTWRWIYIKVLDLHQIVYTSDDHSTALMGKRYVRSTKKTMFEKKSLNYYLSNLYQELEIKRLN